METAESLSGTTADAFAGSQLNVIWVNWEAFQEQPHSYSCVFRELKIVLMDDSIPCNNADCVHVNVYRRW